VNLSTIADRVRHDSTVGNLRVPAFRVMDRLQDVHPADQFRALSLAFVATAEALGLDPHDEVVRARRMMRQAEGPFTDHVQAIRDYARSELARS
jgi:hypothetical protein